jgi:hypothetical protein
MIGGVDETFLERMMVVFQDVPTGYLVLEDVAADRTFATWKALVDARLKALGTEVLSLGSDRAKALTQLAEKGLECLSMPDFFPGMHDLVKSYALAIGRRLPQAHKQLKAAEQALSSPREGMPAAQASQQAQAEVEARRAEVSQWEEIHSRYRQHLATLSLTLHPFGIADSAPQTSEQVHRQ